MLTGVDRYELPDPGLRAYDRGIGTLTAAGEVRGHLACLLGEIRFPGRSPWPWFVMVWPDGTKEPAFEDYGPQWCTVRELDAGYFDHHEQGVPRERRGWFGRTIRWTERGEPRRYEFAWLSDDAAAVTWGELGLSEEDF